MQKKAGSLSRVTKVLTIYSYDHMNRVKTIKKKIGANGIENLIADNVYNESGQLRNKAVGSAIESQQ